MWEVEAGSQTDSSVRLVLDQGWQHKFRLVYTVSLGNTFLDIKLEATNCNQEQDFQFTAALHTYFK